MPELVAEAQVGRVARILHEEVQQEGLGALQLRQEMGADAGACVLDAEVPEGAQQEVAQLRLTPLVQLQPGTSVAQRPRQVVGHEAEQQPQAHRGRQDRRHQSPHAVWRAPLAQEGQRDGRRLEGQVAGLLVEQAVVAALPLQVAVPVHRLHQLGWCRRVGRAGARHEDEVPEDRARHRGHEAQMEVAPHLFRQPLLPDSESHGAVTLRDRDLGRHRAPCRGTYRQRHAELRRVAPGPHHV
mmetsp:Transcript_70540/g.181833  ORF Transcript_70540/g.181833 Transcript_70540/m.181833 type:complete len:241 (+) Transcript_70540:1958-2680(+)